MGIRIRNAAQNASRISRGYLSCDEPRWPAPGHFPQRRGSAGFPQDSLFEMVRGPVQARLRASGWHCHSGSSRGIGSLRWRRYTMKSERSTVTILQSLVCSLMHTRQASAKSIGRSEGKTLCVRPILLTAVHCRNNLRADQVGLVTPSWSQAMRTARWRSQNCSGSNS